MQGQALSDGVPGQTIRVRNLRSRKIIEGVVTANGNVVVRF
jgi:flagella basal body P-ring formation protein FlgA